MTIFQLLLNLGKLLLGGLAFFVGMMVGGTLAAVLQLPPQPMPEGAEASVVLLYFLLESPLLALALALIARGLGGSFWMRALFLAALTWVAYSVNTILESSIFMTAQASSPLYSLVTFLVPSLFCGALVARLFPSDTGARATLPRHSPTGWAWRLALACLAFVPIYLLFGMLVYPITQQYYIQNMYGLNTTAGYAQLIPVLLTRSVLFLLVCLPVILLWQKSERSLILSLGFALFVLVGFLGMLAAYWMPLTLRVPHTVEIMADSFAYAGVLVLLLLGWKRRPA